MEQTGQPWASRHEFIDETDPTGVHEIIGINKDEYIVETVLDTDVSVGTCILNFMRHKDSQGRIGYKRLQQGRQSFYVDIPWDTRERDENFLCHALLEMQREK